MKREVRTPILMLKNQPHSKPDVLRIGIGVLLLFVSAALPVALDRVAPASLVEEMPGSSYRVGGLSEFSERSYGFHSAERAADGTSYMWTQDHAILNFAYAANMGRHAQVSMRIAANRPSGEVPANILVSLNGHPYEQFTTGNPFSVYTFTLDTRQHPGPYLDPAHVQVDITTTTFVVPGDGRRLGVAVDWIRLDPEKSRTDLVAAVAVWTASMLAVLLVGSLRWEMRHALIYAGVALASFAALQISYLPRAITPEAEVALAAIGWLLAGLLAPRAGPLWALGPGICSLFLVSVGGRFLGDYQLDDAYISYRYAWSLAQGHGLVFNPGEVVEGYTNFLWTLLMTLPIGFDIHPAGVALGMNIALSMGLVALTYYLLARSQGPSLWRELIALGGAVLLTVDVSLVTFGARGSGMETVLFAVLVLLAFTLLWRDPSGGRRADLVRGAGGLALALAALTRPEGLLVAALFFGVRYLQDPGSARQRLRLLLPAVLIFAGVVVPYQVWRIAFYGYLFPNTFYAKTGTTWSQLARGAEYAWLFVIDHWLPFALAVTGIGFWWPRGGPDLRSWIRFRTTEIQSGLGPIVVLVTVFMLYVVIVGGDWVAGHRFFVPLLAPLVLLAAAAVRSWTLDSGRAAVSRYTLGVLITLCGALYVRDCISRLSPPATIAVRTHSDNLNTDWWGSAGVWLKHNTTADVWVGAQGAGAIAYYSQRRVIDLLGLTDLHIAHSESPDLGAGKAGHEKRDPAYVLNRRPDYILVVWEDYFDPVDEQLQREYEQMVVRTQVGTVVPWLRLRAGNTGTTGTR